MRSSEPADSDETWQPLITHWLKSKEFDKEDKIISMCGDREKGYISACADLRRVNCPKCLEMYNKQQQS